MAASGRCKLGKESGCIRPSGTFWQAWWGASRSRRRPAALQCGGGLPAGREARRERERVRAGGVGGVEAAARKWSRRSRTEGRPRVVGSAATGLACRTPAAASAASSLSFPCLGWRQARHAGPYLSSEWRKRVGGRGRCVSPERTVQTRSRPKRLASFLDLLPRVSVELPCALLSSGPGPSGLAWTEHG